MEGILGRKLEPGEDVHHLNGEKGDNRASNLAPIDHGEHTRLHNLKRQYRRGYKLKISEAERAVRAERMRKVRRAAIAKALTPWTP